MENIKGVTITKTGEGEVNVNLTELNEELTEELSKRIISAMCAVVKEEVGIRVII